MCRHTAHLINRFSISIITAILCIYSSILYNFAIKIKFCSQIFIRIPTYKSWIVSSRINNTWYVNFVSCLHHLCEIFFISSICIKCNNWIHWCKCTILSRHIDFSIIFIHHRTIIIWKTCTPIKHICRSIISIFHNLTYNKHCRHINFF